MTQLPIFAPSVPVDTSEAAARKIPAATLREQVYKALRNLGSWGATEQEMETIMRLGGNTIRPRLWELEHEKPPRIEKTTRTRPNASGRRARVYVVCGV